MKPQHPDAETPHPGPRAPKRADQAHRTLSAEEHQQIFDEDIVPAFLTGITSHQRPVVVYVLGQPGSGKSRTADQLQRALCGRGAIRICGDAFKAMHPDYHRLLRSHPRTAGSEIRSDYRLWCTKAEAYVRARHGDLIIEAAPADADDFWASALPFIEAGYRIEIVVLAVRAADSRQGTAHRYMLLQQHGLPARFTSVDGHDACYSALPSVIASTLAHPCVSSVLVTRRGLTPLHRAEVSSGRETKQAVFNALITEQTRPYTPAEAATFLTVQDMLARALPEHQAELAAITALATPLMQTFTARAMLPAPRLSYDATPPAHSTECG
ncbi:MULTISPECIES: zeta toxin family protein [unclassified Streptomyces]|uniref:zeta toxin family protein n=1 Tax=unclassified Streptomyces TaxID=2593676 RepID=UPI002E33DF35|nr:MULTISPECIES: zeta toxin family protein [unclassified Streptomyces]WUC69169.1 zeta toxin family protein [Streptomyces sp. NBC_00539]